MTATAQPPISPEVGASGSQRAHLIEATGAQVTELMRFRRARMTSRPCPREVSLPQFWILMMLREGRQTTMGGLADALDITPSSLTAIIDRLEQHGLVARTRDGEDRRVVHIERTAEGERIVHEMVGLQQKHVRELLEQLTDAEVRGLQRGLAGVLRVLVAGGAG